MSDNKLPHVNADHNGQPHIFRISISAHKGQKKVNVNEVDLSPGAGIEGDAHGRSGRPVSLLPYESFAKLAHPDLRIQPGDFAENITTRDVDFSQIRLGTRIQLGEAVLVEVLQIGKKCHHGCIIRETVGDCIMPREGVFARVLQGGRIKEGDPIRILARQ